MTGLCCLGFAPALGALAAAGLGFLLRDALLVPLLGLFLAVTIWSLRREGRRHGHAAPERLSWVAAVLTVAGLWVWAAVTALGLVLLVSASAWNSWLMWRRRAKRAV